MALFQKQIIVLITANNVNKLILQVFKIEEYGVYTMLPAQQLAPMTPWPPDGNLLDRMDDLAHKGKGNGDCHFIIFK